MKKIAGLCAIWPNHWLMLFSPSDPSLTLYSRPKLAKRSLLCRRKVLEKKKKKKFKIFFHFRFVMPFYLRFKYS